MSNRESEFTCMELAAKDLEQEAACLRRTAGVERIKIQHDILKVSLATIEEIGYSFYQKTDILIHLEEAIDLMGDIIIGDLKPPT